jgi:hypothetical protein
MYDRNDVKSYGKRYAGGDTLPRIRAGEKVEESFVSEGMQKAKRIVIHLKRE